ncbi:hypothetical protein C8A00DRAFT_10768 [Chaetomidium leptoderma]|uniref:Uncharacterized protein n=1 Tax=Chaetomidium leptoderma TaxID=669021 RepID=A0AAN6VVG8_9PEZI|nr:hypothetical protein C8A00DRAFT_10768 [Chaetomidium leptoderma]
MPQTPPTFTFGRTGQGYQQHHHRPAFSSPLSSSPIRAASVSPPPYQQQPQNHQTISQPLSPCNANYLNTLPRPRETQSSPIPCPSIFDNNAVGGNSNNNSKFRFATRNPRPNPVLKRREDLQEGRRRLFFQNVRQRQEDKRWEMRGGEDELLKLEWWRLNRERQQAKEAEVEQYLGVMDADVMAREEEELQMQMQMQMHAHQDMDALMADAIAQQEEAEVDALVSSLQGQDQAHFSDDDDYDELFMDLIMQQQQQQQQQGGQGMGQSQDVEMS